MKRILIIVYILFLQLAGSAQNNFSILVQPQVISGLPALQSFAAAQYNNKWVLIGGRTDGLHQRQPTTSFLSSGNNTNIYVVDPVLNSVWSASVNSLPAALREQLQSTNMNFCYSGNKMYIIGGYGYSATLGNHKTYASLVVIDLPGLINAVVNNTSITSYFRQLNDNFFAVTGGQLGKIGDMFLLVGGQKFDGRYNPNNGPSFTQEYTNQIRKFKLNDDGINLSVSYQNTITDINQLHRRDYNMAPQVFPDGKLGYTAFSGVFQVVANLPFLNTVDLDTISYTPNNSFSQYLNHYHSGKLSVFDSLANAMSTIFFGGMAQYYYDAGGNLIQDNEVPFVSTISRVTRTSNGSMTETKIGNLPGLLGSGAELIVNHSLPMYSNEVIRLNDISQDTVLAGYLVGGILSSAPNIFFINNGTQSSATATVYRILLVKTTPLPVQITYFRGKKKANAVLLTWGTSSETDNNRFEIERSADGVQFSFIGAVAGQAGNDISRSYLFEDIHPLPGLGYYRLKQVNNDGSFRFSTTILIRFQADNPGFLMYPNPVGEKLVVEFDETPAGRFWINILDLQGRELLRRQVTGDSRQINIDTRSLPGGHYVLKIETDQKTYSGKFVKN